MSAVPFYTYKPFGESCFVIEDPEGDMLIGDQLPGTEEEARLLCRVANIAHEQAVRATLDECATAVAVLSRRLRHRP